MPNTYRIVTAQGMQLKFVSIPEALMGTTAETLIMKEVHGVTPQIQRPAGSTAVCLVVEINLDLVGFEGAITNHITLNVDYGVLSLYVTSYAPRTGERSMYNVGNLFPEEPVIPEGEGCYEGDGTSYRGAMSETISGKKCQFWTSMEPHKHSKTPQKFPKA